MGKPKMQDFRRWVIGIAETIQTGMLILATIGAGLWGMGIARFLAVASGSDHPGSAALFGFLIGAAIGFVIAATAAAVFFILTDIASNTQRTVELLQRAQIIASNAAQTATTQPRSNPVAPTQISPVNWDNSIKAGSELPFSEKTLSAEAKTVLEKAKSYGYEISWKKEDEVTLSKRGVVTFCRSNAEIVRQDKFLRE